MPGFSEISHQNSCLTLSRYEMSLYTNLNQLCWPLSYSMPKTRIATKPLKWSLLYVITTRFFRALLNNSCTLQRNPYPPLPITKPTHTHPYHPSRKVEVNLCENENSVQFSFLQWEVVGTHISIFRNRPPGMSGVGCQMWKWFSEPGVALYNRVHSE